MPLRSTITWRAKDVFFRNQGYHKIAWHASCGHGVAGSIEICDTEATDYTSSNKVPAGVTLDLHLDAVRHFVGVQCGYRYWQTRSYRECP